MISADKDCYMVEMPKEAAWGDMRLQAFLI